MKSITVTIFLVATCLILFVICLSRLESQDISLWAGLLSLLVGSMLLNHSLKDKPTSISDSGFKWRGIMVGAAGVIGGLISIINFFFN